MPGDSTGKHMTFAVNSFELSVCLCTSQTFCAGLTFNCVFNGFSIALQKLSRVFRYKTNVILNSDVLIVLWLVCSV